MDSDKVNQMISPIAAFIGARLQYPLPECNGAGSPWVSTIHVHQHKEKFWYVRVYCDLAHPGLVKRKWEWHLARHAERLAGVKFYDRTPSAVFKMIESATGDDPPEEFTKHCVKADAMHYRKCYTDMVKLCPDLAVKICDQADRAELVQLTSVECEAWLDKIQAATGGINWLQHLCTDIYHVADVPELKEFLKAVYASKW